MCSLASFALSAETAFRRPAEPRETLKKNKSQMPNRKAGLIDETHTLVGMNKVKRETEKN